MKLTFLRAQVVGYVLALCFLFLLNIIACKKDDDNNNNSPKLLISSFAPAEASEGGTVVIKGSGFSDQKESNSIKFYFSPK